MTIFGQVVNLKKKEKKRIKQQTNPLHKQLAREKSTLELIIKILGW